MATRRVFLLNGKAIFFQKINTCGGGDTKEERLKNPLAPKNAGFLE